MEMAGDFPDIVIGPFGGGSNFTGLSFPFSGHGLLDMSAYDQYFREAAG